MSGLVTALLLAAGPVVAITSTDPRMGAAPVAAVRAGAPVRLAIVVAEDGACWSDAEGTTRDGVRCEALPPSARTSVRWTLAVPLARDYDNTRACSPQAIAQGCHEPILYELVELEELRGRTRVDAHAVARLARPGAHRLAVHLAWRGRELSSPGPRHAGEGDALVPAMFELVVRRDDTYVGHLTELLGVPFVLGPAHLPGLGHQADRRLGADCVALVIYGRRRIGEGYGYVAPPVLERWTELVGTAESLVAADGRVADVGVVAEGDVLHFGFQTAVLAEDREPRGRLDAHDLVIHTFHGVAVEVPLGQVPYRHHRAEIRRWRPRTAAAGATE